MLESVIFPQLSTAFVSFAEAPLPGSLNHERVNAI
jgi:hypothetical protein